MKYVQNTNEYVIRLQDNQKHLYHIDINENVLNDFLAKVKDINVQRIEYVPFMRFFIASELRNLIGEDFHKTLKGILQERETGGFTLGVEHVTNDKNDYLKISTAITHLVGISNFDSMTGTYYASFDVTHSDDSDTYLRQPYRTLEFHTDGTFVKQRTDWLLMMKWEERNANGGDSRLLHLDDWDEMDKFRNHPLAGHKFKFSYAHKQSKKTEDDVYKTTFFEMNNATCINFNDQATHPETVEQGVYLKELSDSMENSPGVQTLPLPEGRLVMLNNHFWLHGREAFKEDQGLFRQLMRQRGSFGN
ncbi:protein CsiD [Neobacillus niacini]|uniref:glutarate dioxygenase GlaH n=1 Tax=Neobacillus niacini TaxID=86668 RepID=UPI002781BB51|nr:glutarate dioxygenase GlaH [Neobacillus niacini]MDQ1002200.1 protein CsiD [Neobacillus niacini]